MLEHKERAYQTYLSQSQASLA